MMGIITPAAVDGARSIGADCAAGSTFACGLGYLLIFATGACIGYLVYLATQR